MPTYEIETSYGLLKVDHGGTHEELESAVNEWVKGQSGDSKAFFNNQSPAAQPSGDRQFLDKSDPNALSPFVGESTSLANPSVNTQEEFEAALNDPLLTLPKPANRGPISGVVRGLESTVEGLTSPVNIGLLASIGGAPKAIQSAANIAFRATMIKSGVDKISEALEPGKTPGQRAEALVQGGGMVAMGGHPESRIREPGNFQTAEPSQEMLDRAATQDQLRKLAPETAQEIDPKPKGSPEILDGLQIARRKLVDNFNDHPPEVQKARQTAIDQIDEALLAHDKDAVNESAARTAQPEPPTGQQEPPTKTEAPASPPAELSEIEKVKQQLRGSGAPLTAEAIPETPSPPKEMTWMEEALSERRAQGWDDKWPFIPADLHNRNFVDAILSDPMLSDAEKERIKKFIPIKLESETPSPPPQVERAPAPAAEERTVADEKAGAAEVEQPTRQSPLDQLKALNEDAGAAPLPGEKLADDLRKLGRVNRDPAQSVARELSYYSDEERQQLQEHLGTEDANPDTLAQAITGKPKLKEASRPSEYVDEPGGKKGRGHPSDFGEDYVGGPGAMGPRELEALKSAQTSTGLKKATVLTERLARGEEPLPAAERQSETEAVGRAMETQDRDPAAPRNLVARILDKGDTAITRDEAALLLVERNRVTEDMRQADAMLKNPNANTVERTDAHLKMIDLEEQIDRLDRAQREAGSQWGRVGRMYQQMIREDYSLEGIQRKMRTAKGGPLTEAERTESAKLAEATQKAIDAQEKAAAARTADQEKDDLKYFYEQTIKDLTKEAAKAPKISKPVLDIAQKIVDRWKGEADEARKSLRARLGRTSAGVDPTIVLDVAKIMRAHVGEIGLDLAKVTARVLEDFGEEVKPYLKDAWKKARDLIDKEGGPAAAREAAKKGIPAKEKTTTDIAAKAKAEATAGEELSNQTVYELARAHIKAGVHGEDAVMAAVHKDIKEAYPSATERDVRRAFSDYGKTKFPSQEAVAKELRELRTLTRLQESIDRLKEGQDALKTGPQRDKASQEIREKQKQLDELLKTRQGPPSPEKLASREEAKVNALKNRIADIDKELKTGERPPESATLPDSPAVEQLKAERDAMQKKLDEIRGEGKEKPTPEESYNKRRMTQITKQVADLEDRLKTGKLEKEKPVPLKKTAEVAAAEAKLTAVRREVDKAIEKKKYDQLSPQQKFFKEAMSMLHSITALKILGHGSVGMVTHAGGLIFRPTRAAIYWRNFGRQFAMWAKPELHEQLIHRLKNDPEFETWKKAGASIDPDKTYTDYGMYAQWLGKLGEAGGRGFDALKLVRMELNKADWKGVPDEIKDDPKQADSARKLIAEINNKATGTAPKTSPMGKSIEEGFYGAAKNPIIEAAFFAPRLYASRWGRVLFDPVKTVRTLMDPASSPVERFAANKKLKNAAEFTGTLLGALLTNQAILSATGSKQNVNLTDPKKSDWLKFKAGDKTITADGGLLDPVRLVGQVMWKDLLAERTKSEQYREGTRFKMAADTVANYLRGKLSPPVGLATDVATGSDFQGRPLPWSKDKPQFKDQTPYTYGEWLLDQGPIPLEGAAKEVAAEVKKQGFKDHEVQVILRAAMAFGLGMAGVHVGEDYGPGQKKKKR